MKFLTGRRIQVEFIDCATDWFEQVGPHVQGLCGHTTTTGLGLTFGPAIKQGHLSTTTGQQFSGKRSGWSRPNNQYVKMLHGLLKGKSPIDNKVLLIIDAPKPVSNGEHREPGAVA